MATLLAIGVVAPAASLTASTVAAAAVPKVVIVVGPSGASTELYRSQGRATAAVARRYTPDVIELYSPDATWPAVRQALQGASVVVYMGHGNGWPSRYHDSLFPTTEDGFGLNPVAGGDDYAHQYFGESFVASQIRLAPSAVVLLNHLCYASGLSEPGLPEGTVSEAMQRIDNFAAGFIDAGAAAVVAEAYTSPTYMMRQVLGGGRPIEAAWRLSPSANGNRRVFGSARSPGYLAEMDTVNQSSGFTRSIVLRSGLAPADVRAGARGSASGSFSFFPGPPTLVGAGIKLSAPDITTLTTAASTVDLDLPYQITNRLTAPAKLEASVRFDPLVPVDPAGPPPQQPGTDPSDPNADPAFGSFGQPPTDVDLVTPEQAGSEISPSVLTRSATTMTLPVKLPATPGRYRLTVTLHDGDGVEYDAKTQGMIPPLIVRVTGDYDGEVLAAPTATLTAGTAATLPVRVVNLGTTRWGLSAVTSPGLGIPDVPDIPARVVARWIPLAPEALGSTDPGAAFSSSLLPVDVEPGDNVTAQLPLNVPTVPGPYLVVLDVVTPQSGSLTATGWGPTLIRVNVQRLGDNDSG
jgi:hypothetical protein